MNSLALPQQPCELLVSRSKYHRLVDIVSTPESRAGLKYPLHVAACGLEVQTCSIFGGGHWPFLMKLVGGPERFGKRLCRKCFPDGATAVAPPAVPPSVPAAGTTIILT